MNHVLAAITSAAIGLLLFTSCGGNSSVGPAFVDSGADREAFINQKEAEPGAPDLPDAAPIESSELNKLLNEAERQKQQNIKDGAAVSGSVNGFNPGALDTNGMEATMPDNSGLDLPEDWKNPTINSGDNPSMSDVDSLFEDDNGSSDSSATNG